MIRRALLASVLLAAAGCNVVSIDEYPCPTSGTTLTYENFGSFFFAYQCNTCHSAPDGQRNGAPDSFVFDTQAEIISHKDRIFVRAADTNNSMPVGPDMIPMSQRVRLAEWLACGAP